MQPGLQTPPQGVSETRGGKGERGRGRGGLTSPALAGSLPQQEVGSSTGTVLILTGRAEDFLC